MDDQVRTSSEVVRACCEQSIVSLDEPFVEHCLAREHIHVSEHRMRHRKHNVLVEEVQDQLRVT